MSDDTCIHIMHTFSTGQPSPAQSPIGEAVMGRESESVSVSDTKGKKKEREKKEKKCRHVLEEGGMYHTHDVPYELLCMGTMGHVETLPPTLTLTPSLDM